MKLIRAIARKVIDRLQYKKNPNAELIGHKNAAWCLDTSRTYLTESPILFSGGAGNDISFEKKFAELFNGTIYLYDPSPTGKKTVEKDSPINKFFFIPKALGKESGSIKMSKPKDPLEGSWTINGGGGNGVDEFESVSLVKEIQRYGYQKIDVVKLDIEGFEYEVIDELLNSPLEIRQILVEFHDFFPNISILKSLKMRWLLKKKGYTCFYKHHYDFSFYKS